MTKKLITLSLALVFLTMAAGCDAGFRKSKISRAVKEYVSPALDADEEYAFVGTSNNRDTLYMGVTRPCVGVIYTVTEKDSGYVTRHYADVIFSNDYEVALNVTELDFDPIEYTKEKVRDGFVRAFRETLKH